MFCETQSFTLFCLSSFTHILCRYEFEYVEFCSETTQPIYFVFYLCKYDSSVEMLIFPPLDFGCLGFNLYFCRWNRECEFVFVNN